MSFETLGFACPPRSPKADYLYIIDIANFRSNISKYYLIIIGFGEARRAGTVFSPAGEKERAKSARVKFSTLASLKLRRSGPGKISRFQKTIPSFQVIHRNEQLLTFLSTISHFHSIIFHCHIRVNHSASAKNRFPEYFFQKNKKMALKSH